MGKLKEMDSLDEFKDDELRLIFNEIAGASQRNEDDAAEEPAGISLTDFMLMMMAK